MQIKTKKIFFLIFGVRQGLTLLLRISLGMENQGYLVLLENLFIGMFDFFLKIFFNFIYIF